MGSWKEPRARPSQGSGKPAFAPASKQGPPRSTGLICKSLAGPNVIMDGTLGCFSAVSNFSRSARCALKREHRAGHLNILLRL